MGLLVATVMVRFFIVKVPVGVGLALIVRAASTASVVIAITGSTWRVMSVLPVSSSARLILRERNNELEINVTKNVSIDRHSTVPARFSCLWPPRFRLVGDTPPPIGDLVRQKLFMRLY